MNPTDLELLERVNPVFNTAKTTLYRLSMIGDKDAEYLAGKLGLTFDQTQNSKSMETQMDESFQAGLIMMEARYRTMMAMALASGCAAMVDLPCGYTPRAIECARLGKPFVGLDLPATIAEAEPVIRAMLKPEEQALVRFAGVDATNYSSMKEVFDQIEGSVCITTEGLLMYFAEAEVAALADNIKRILDDHGGCWITADPECAIQYGMTLKAVAGANIGQVILREKAKMEDKSDVRLDANSMRISIGPAAREGMQKAFAFLAAHGLKAERVPIADHMPELASLRLISEEQAEQHRQFMTQCCYWKITSTGAAGNVHREDGQFSVSTSVDGDTLLMKLTGRMDTLTAPEVLEIYEKLAAAKPFRTIVVDCNALEYVSSAGLRVWLIMHKAADEGVALSGVNRTVADILEQTGFVDILRTV